MAIYRAGADDVPGPDDAELVRRVRSGDVHAFEVLVRRYQRRIYNLALRYSGDPEDARDLTQEAFIRAYQALASFRGEASFPTWLYRIATNVCFDELRRRRHRPEATLDEPLATRDGETERQVADVQPGPVQQLEQKELAEIIQREIAALPEEYRAVVILRDLQGLSYEEIAAVLGISLGTVKSRLHRARAALRVRFEALELFPAAGVHRVKEDADPERGEVR